VILYRTNPANVDITALYDPKGESFYRIGQFMTLAEFNANPIRNCLGGDCFTIRTKMKICFAHSGYPTEGDLMNIHMSTTPYEKGYGHWIEFTCECENNFDSLTKVGVNQSARMDPSGSHANAYDLPETEEYNRGYSKTLDLKFWTGIDIRIPVQSALQYNRVRASNQKIDNSVIDAFRQFDLLSFKDYGSSYGAYGNIDRT